MNKIFLITLREYLTRVRKVSFIVMAILGPVLLAAMMIVPIWFAMQQGDTKRIEVIDKSGIFKGKLTGTENLHFSYTTLTLEEAKADLAENSFDGLLYIPQINLDKPEGITLYSLKSPSSATRIMIEKTLRREIEDAKLVNSGLDKKVLENIRTHVSLQTKTLGADGEQNSNTDAATGIGYFSAFMIYMFIFIYGVQVMRGVTEEKTNRIVEVIISSVKPFQLMMGKIIGIAAVALTQFLIWVVLSFAITTFVSARFQLDRFSNARISDTLSKMEDKDVQQAMEINDVMTKLQSVDTSLIVGCFIFYFLGGYLLYGALFGAIGAVVDNETDTQQFTLPVTIPLILAIVMASAVLKEPEGSLAFWMSVIPLTSPIIMMVRLPFIGATWELALSMGLLVLGFILAVWIAARIYRVGVLMYGKKVTYKELAKWLFYKI